MKLLKTINEFVGDAQSNLKTSDGNDAGQTDVKSYNVSFNMLRNTINQGDGENVQASDVNNYLERAHEINNEVDTVEYGLETDDGRIIKIWVNAADATAFQDEMQHLLGVENDIEEAINTLASKFDIVDVVWPDANQATADVPDAEATDDLGVTDDLDAVGDDDRDGATLAKAALDKINGKSSDDKDDDDEPTNETKAPMSIGSDFFKRVMQEADEADVDGINDGLNIKLDPRQRSIMLRLRRAIDRKILALFAMIGVPGRYMDVEGIDGLIKEAGLKLRASPTQQAAFNSFYTALGNARGFGTAPDAETVAEAGEENLKGAYIQKMLEGIAVHLGLPESLVVSGGPQQVSLAFYNCAKLIEDDGALEAAMRKLAQRLKVSSSAEKPAEKVAEDVNTGGDPFLAAVVTLVEALGIPEANLNYQRSNVLNSLRALKLSLNNRSMIQQRMAALSTLIAANVKQTAGQPADTTDTAGTAGTA
jgi:hypothetical protein